MNFSPFGVGVPLSTALPVATQFTQGKITQNVTTANGQVVGVLQGGENGIHYIRPLETNAFTTNAQPQQTQQTQIITLPITMPGAKPGDPQQTVQIQVVNPAPPPVSQSSSVQSPKYHISQIPLQSFGQGATVLTVAYNGNQEGIQIVDGQNGIPEGMTVVAALQPQDIQLIQTTQQQEEGKNNKDVNMTPVALIKTENKDEQESQAGTSIAINTHYIQSSAAVQEYLQRIQSSTLPLSLQQFLKFNTDVKREQITEDGVIEAVVETGEEQEQTLIMNEINGEMDHEENPEVTEQTKGKKKRYDTSISFVDILQ